MVVFEDAIAKKSEYRRFAIRGADGQGALDDLSALYETLNASIPAWQYRRRFRRKHGQRTAGIRTGRTGREAVGAAERRPSSFAYKPNLVVVDGGKPQVMAAAKALEDCGVDDVAVCGLAKRLEEVWVPDDDYPIILKRQSEGMYLLQRVRDESHRFAITYHARHEGKVRCVPHWTIFPRRRGVSEASAEPFWFGSCHAGANAEDFEQVKGVGKAKAEAIYQALHARDGQ